MKIEDQRNSKLNQKLGDCCTGTIVEIDDFDGLCIITDKLSSDDGIVCTRLDDGYCFQFKKTRDAQTVNCKLIITD